MNLQIDITLETNNLIVESQNLIHFAINRICARLKITLFIYQFTQQAQILIKREILCKRFSKRYL